MANKISKSGLNYIFPGEPIKTASPDPLTNAAAVLRPRDETAGDVRDVMSGSAARKSESPSQYRFVSQPPPPKGNVVALSERRPPRSTRTPTDYPYSEEEPSSSSMRTIKAAFNGLHPLAQSCIARLMVCVDNSFEFYQLYQSLLDTQYKATTGKSSLSANILMLKGLSTLLDGKLISLPFLASGAPGQHKNLHSTLNQEWMIVHCTDESLDVNLPHVRVIRKGGNPRSGTIFTVPLDVVLFFNKPY